MREGLAEQLQTHTLGLDRHDQQPSLNIVWQWLCGVEGAVVAIPGIISKGWVCTHQVEEKVLLLGWTGYEPAA